MYRFASEGKISIIVGLPSVVWHKDEVETCKGINNSGLPREAAWLLILEEALLVVQPTEGTRAIIVRTNIRKLSTIIKKDLYVRHEAAVKIAVRIHKHLREMSESTISPEHTGPSINTTPIELRTSLIQ